MIVLELFDKNTKKIFKKYFVNEFSAFKYKRKMKYAKNIQVVGEPYYMSKESILSNDNNDKK